MKFLLDMGISPSVTKFLNSLGHDAVHLLDLQMARAHDQAIVELARLQTRIILTHDLDFGALMAASGRQLPSVIIFRLGDMRPLNVAKYLELLLIHYADDLMVGAILSVNEQRVRVRRLPFYPENF